MPLAYRVWQWKKGLKSLYFNNMWLPRANFAKCLARPDPADIYDDTYALYDCSSDYELTPCTISPNKNCPDSRGFGCGLWAHLNITLGLAELGPRTDYGTWNPKVPGLVYGWGNIIEKEDGLLRCEIMDIWAIAPVRGQVDHHWPDIKQWARENNIPCELFDDMDGSVKYLRRMSVELQRR